MVLLANLMETIYRARNFVEKNKPSRITGSRKISHYVVEPVLLQLEWNIFDDNEVELEELNMYYDNVSLYKLKINGVVVGAVLVVWDVNDDYIPRKIDRDYIDELGKYPVIIMTDGNTWKIYKPRGESFDEWLLIDSWKVVGESVMRVAMKMLYIMNPRNIMAYISEEDNIFLEVYKRVSEARKTREAGYLTEKKAELKVLEVLYGIGGVMRRKDIIRKVKHMVQLSDYDKRRVKSGKPRWYATINWAISKLHEKGLIESVGHGYWRITEKGKQYLMKQKNTARF